MKTTKDTLTEFDIRLIEGLIGALSTHTLICTIQSVAKSGMTRRMKFYTCNDAMGLSHVSRLFELADYKRDKNGAVIVEGFGMDMVWDTVYTLAHKLYELGYISIEMLPRLSQASARVI